jgi:hypothetical protein
VLEPREELLPLTLDRLVEERVDPVGEGRDLFCHRNAGLGRQRPIM